MNGQSLTSNTVRTKPSWTAAAAATATADASHRALYAFFRFVYVFKWSEVKLVCARVRKTFHTRCLSLLHTTSQRSRSCSSPSRLAHQHIRSSNAVMLCWTVWMRCWPTTSIPRQFERKKQFSLFFFSTFSKQEKAKRRKKNHHDKQNNNIENQMDKHVKWFELITREYIIFNRLQKIQ